MAQRKPKKSHPSDLLWLPPLSPQLLSPGREKALSTNATRRKPLPRSIFNLEKVRRKQQQQQQQQQSIEVEEPTSPKVSCIGKVRTNKKKETGQEFSRENSVSEGRSRTGFPSPARFFTSPGRQLKWASLFGSRKEAATSSAGHGDNDGGGSCLGFACDSPSVLYREGRNCGAFLARSLMLLQDRGHVSENKADSERLSAHTLEINQHWPTFSAFSNQEEVKESEGAAGVMNAGHENCDQHVAENLSKAQYKDVICAPLLTVSQNKIKFSLDIVPETWLCRDDERLSPHSSIDKDGDIVHASSMIDVAKEETAQTCMNSIDWSCGGSREVAVTGELMPHTSYECTSKRAQLSAVMQSCVPMQLGSKLTDVKPNVCKEKSCEMHDVSESYGVIVVGYKFQPQSLIGDKVDGKEASQHVIEGLLKVGQLSLQGVGTDSPWLKGEAEFIRSFSATCYRTVMRLQRSNSEPPRPFH